MKTKVKVEEVKEQGEILFKVYIFVIGPGGGDWLYHSLHKKVGEALDIAKGLEKGEYPRVIYETPNKEVSHDD